MMLLHTNHQLVSVRKVLSTVAYYSESKRFQILPPYRPEFPDL